MVAGRWKKETRTYSTAIMQASFPLFISPVSPSLDSKVETVNQIHEEKAPEKPSISGLRSKKGGSYGVGEIPWAFLFFPFTPVSAPKQYQISPCGNGSSTQTGSKSSKKPSSLTKTLQFPIGRGKSLFLLSFILLPVGQRSWHYCGKCAKVWGN